MSNNKPLTSWSKGSGCGCKIAPATLQEILRGVRSEGKFPQLLVGNENYDDAAVLDLGDDRCIVSTTDFFTPVVDDPIAFGTIAAANAMSDVYAMGGTPIMSVAILGWPVEQLDPALAGLVIQGATAKCAEAGIPLAGGHSIDTPVPFFGLAVTGTLHRSMLKRNTGAREGDILFLTKPIGTGLILAASRRDQISAESLAIGMRSMAELNSCGADFAKLSGVRAMTDVTGYGLAGHLLEMVAQSGLTAEINFSAIPVFKEVYELADQMIYPDMTMKTYAAIADQVNSLSVRQLLVCCDPQTSGGLLIAVDPRAVDDYITSCRKLNMPEFTMSPVGRFVKSNGKPLHIL